VLILVVKEIAVPFCHARSSLLFLVTVTSRQDNNKEQAHTRNKGTNEHDKKEPKKGTAISLKTSINTRRWPNWAEICCVILKFKV
jgi:hypothetical protein